MPAEPWFQRCLDEINSHAIKYPKRLKDKDKIFLRDITPRIKLGLSLTVPQQDYLRGLQEKMTEPVRIKWR